MWRQLIGVFAMLLLIIAGLIAVAIILFLVWEFTCHMLSHLMAYRVRRQLMAKGRFREWSQCVEAFRQGQGTLIVQYATPGGWLHGGPIYEWWTEDDLAGHAPVPLPTRLNRLPEEHALRQILEYSDNIASKYVDVNSGLAVLTLAPKPVGWWFDRAVPTIMGVGQHGKVPPITGRKLSEMHPNGKVVTLLIWKGDWLLLLGDAAIMTTTN